MTARSTFPIPLLMQLTARYRRTRRYLPPAARRLAPCPYKPRSSPWTCPDTPPWNRVRRWKPGSTRPEEMDRPGDRTPVEPKRQARPVPRDSS
jgi:hypothetical protein